MSIYKSEETKEIKSLEEYAAETIIDEIEDLIGTDITGCDLASRITERMNLDGSCTCNSYLAREFLDANSEDIAEFLEEFEGEMGVPCQYDFFRNPEALMVLAVISQVNKLLSDTDWVDYNWSKTKTITKKVAKQIQDEMEKLL